MREATRTDAGVLGRPGVVRHNNGPCGVSQHKQVPNRTGQEAARQPRQPALPGPALSSPSRPPYTPCLPSLFTGSCFGPDGPHTPGRTVNTNGCGGPVSPSSLLRSVAQAAPRSWSSHPQPWGRPPAVLPAVVGSRAALSCVRNISVLPRVSNKSNTVLTNSFAKNTLQRLNIYARYTLETLMVCSDFVTYSEI